MEGVRRVSGWFLERVWNVFEGVWKGSRRFMVGVWEVPGRCLYAFLFNFFTTFYFNPNFFKKPKLNKHDTVAGSSVHTNNFAGKG